MNNDKFISWVQAVLSGIYLTATFLVIFIYELGYSKLTSQGQEKTFDSMVSWMTGGALIVLYFWLQRAKAQSIPDPTTATVTQTTQSTTLPTLPETPDGTLKTTIPVTATTDLTQRVPNPGTGAT